MATKRTHQAEHEEDTAMVDVLRDIQRSLRNHSVTMADMGTKLDRIESRLDGFDNFRNEIQQQHVQSRDKMDKTTKDQIEASQAQTVKKMEREVDRQLQLLRRDVYDVIEKESALTRELTLTPGLDVRSTYEFYFRVDDFTRQVGADVGIFSCPWYIRQMDTCLRGYVSFRPDGNLSIKLSDGRCPKVVGLQPRPAKGYTYKVSLVDEERNREVQLKKDEPQLELNGAFVRLHNEGTDMVAFGSFGVHVTTLPCTQIQDDGFVKKHRDSHWIILKYTITVG